MCSSRFEAVDEYTRGPAPPVTQRRLWDPSSQASLAPPIPRQAAVPPINTTSSQRYDTSKPTVSSPIPLSPRRDRPSERDRGRADEYDREYDRRSTPRMDQSPRPAPSRRLFDPNDSIGRSSGGSMASSRRDEGHSSRRVAELGSESRMSGRRTPRTPEEEADRERERRRRKEGSERGSLAASAMAKRREKERDDGRSKRSMGSKSSEGSESFKDRERGKGRA